MPLPPTRSSNPSLDDARRFVDQGQLKKARACFKKAMRHDRRNPEIPAEFGAAEALSGNVASARKLMQAATRLAPGQATYHFNLGELERQQRRYPEAETSFRAALLHDPADADAAFGLGVCRLMQGDPAEAIDVLRTASKLAPADPEILMVLSKALLADGRYQDASTVLEQLTGRNPDDAGSWFDLALAREKLRQFPEASQAFRNAHSRRPIPVEERWKWALVEVRCSRYDRALELLDEAIDVRDDVSDLFFARAITHQYLGDFDQADRDLRRTVQLQPDHAEAYQHLAQMGRLVPQDVAQLENLLQAGPSRSNTSRAAAGYTLYKYFDARDEREEAFRALSEATRLQSELCVFTSADHEELAARVKSVFTPDFFQARTGQGSTSEVPVFVLGMPRSGTTLVEQILASYPQVHAGEETLIVPDLTARLAGYPETVLDLPSDWAARQAEDILDKLERHAGKAAHITDKTPANYYNIGLITWLFPRARIIYCDRDPRDTGFSCYEQNFGYNIDFACDLDAFVDAYRVHLDVMNHWFTTIPSNILRVSYEALVSEPAVEARKIVEFCGLEWDEDCVDTSKFTNPVQTASYWQVRQPISTRSIGKWRRYAEFLGEFCDRLDKLDRSMAGKNQ